MPSHQPAWVWKTDAGIQAVLERAVARDPKRPDLLPSTIVNELNAAGYKIVKDPLHEPDPFDPPTGPYSDEPLGTCIVHGDYWTDNCTRCGSDW